MLNNGELMKTVLKILFTLSIFYSAGTFAQQVVLRSAISPQQAWIGQQAILHVDVLVDEGWAQVKKFYIDSPDNVFMRQMETQGTRISETIDGVSYSGQRYELMLFSGAEGVIKIPAIPVDVEVKNWGSGGDASIQQLQTPATSFTSRTPADTKGLQGLISTTDMSAEQTWEPEVNELKAGDTIQRTIRLQADDVPGMLLAPVSFSRLDGVGVYQKEPTVADSYGRGELSGTREEAVSYVFEKPGLAEIPAVTFYWWNVSSEQLEMIILDGLKVQVLAGSSTTDADSGQLKDSNRFSLLLLFAALLTITALAVLYRKPIMKNWASYTATRQASEPNVFKRLIKSLRSRDAGSSLRDLMRWIDRIDYDTHSLLLNDFVVKFGDAGLKQAVDDLIRCANNRTPISSSSAIIKPLKSARKEWKKESARKKVVGNVLPELN
jgi:hypothetical protein